MSRVKRNYAYNVGDVANAIPNWTLTCTKAGTTSTDIINIQAGTIIDGTCEWNCVNSGGGGAVTNYSTEEQRIGTWIDGKLLYQKSYSGTLAGTVMSTIDSSLGKIIDWIVDGSTTVNLPIGSSNYLIPNGFYATTQYISKPFKTDENKIVIKASDEYNSLPYTATIQYTKTTD